MGAFRKIRYAEPPRVFIHLEWRGGEDDRWVRLWIRNCPGRWCELVCENLKKLGVVKKAGGKKIKDLAQRERHYKDYWEVWLEGVAEEYETELLQVAIQSQFRIIPGCVVEWLSAYRILNMKIWHRKEQ